MGCTTTALPNRIAARSCASCVMRSPTMTAPAPLARNTKPSRLSRVRCRCTGLATNTSVASNDAAIAHSTGSNSSDGATCAAGPAAWPAACPDGSTIAGIQNDSATPSAAACAIADDANTIRRSTTWTPIAPSSAPARPPTQIASLKIARFAHSSCQDGPPTMSLTGGPRRGRRSGRRRARTRAARACAAARRGQRHAVVAVEQQRAVGALEAVLDQVGDHHDGGAALGAQLSRSAPAPRARRWRPARSSARPGTPGRRRSRAPAPSGPAGAARPTDRAAGGARAPARPPRPARRRRARRWRGARATSRCRGPAAHQHEVEDRDREDRVQRRLLRHVGETQLRRGARSCR